MLFRSDRTDAVMRVTGVAQAPLRPGWMSGGLVVDRDAVGSAVGSALKHELGANYRKTVNQE